MARYSRRRGPVADFELTLADQIISGMTVTRFFGPGTLLILFKASYFNPTGTSAFPRLRIVVDGTETPTGSINRSTFPAHRVYLLGQALIPISAGIHTIEIRVDGVAAVGDVIEANSAELDVIELPTWDQDTDLL